MGRASISNNVQEEKSFEEATWIRLPLPFVAKAYHIPSVAWRKLGSGKSVCRPIKTPFVRFGRRGELRTVGSNARVKVTHVKRKAEEKSRIANQI